VKQLEVTSEMFFSTRVGMQKLLEIQKVRFLLVGATNTVVGYLLFAALLWAFGQQSYVLVSFMSHLLATTLSFILNRAYVFGSSGRALVDYLRFQLTYTVAFCANLAFLIALVELLRWPVLLAQAVCLVLVTPLSYLGHKNFSFRRNLPAGSMK
jgi:putative flippase GtrA